MLPVVPHFGKRWTKVSLNLVFHSSFVGFLSRRRLSACCARRPNTSRWRRKKRHHHFSILFSVTVYDEVSFVRTLSLYILDASMMMLSLVGGLAC